jgi:hypothetical protein
MSGGFLQAQYKKLFTPPRFWYKKKGFNAQFYLGDQICLRYAKYAAKNPWWGAM